MAVRISFAFRVAAVPVLLAVIAIVETRHPFNMFRLVSLGVVFFLLVDIASLLRGNWRDFLLVLTSLAFGIFLIEAAANILEPKQSTVVSPEGLYGSRPAIGWGPGHPGRFHAEKTDPKMGATIYSVDYTIDSNLLRQTLSCETGPTVVFLAARSLSGKG
jgi:hypothetical protein